MDHNKVAVLLEELMAQFRTFGEGLDILQGEIKKSKMKLLTSEMKQSNVFLKMAVNTNN